MDEQEIKTHFYRIQFEKVIIHMYQFKYIIKAKEYYSNSTFYLEIDYDITINRFRSNYPNSWNYILLSK